MGVANIDGEENAIVRLLLVDTRLDGHHMTYMEALIKAGIENYFEVFLAIPRTNQCFSRIINVSYLTSCHGHSLDYPKFVSEIKRIIKETKPDIVHFLFCDAFFRYFAFGLISKKAKTVVTCHQIRRSFLRDISYRLIGKRVDAVVVHTKKLEFDFLGLSIKNTYHIEYPRFDECQNVISIDEARERIGIHIGNEKVLLAIGGTRFDKGLDILLYALRKISSPFHLIIAGKEEGFTKEFIEEQIKPYRKNVTLFLEYLSDEKFHLCLTAADIVVLPYKKSFDGASGPLGESVWLNKEIIGSDHKSLGAIIEENHLGSTFECANIESLGGALEKALVNPWSPDEKYTSYRNSLDKKVFQNKYIELYKKMLG